MGREIAKASQGCHSRSQGCILGRPEGIEMKNLAHVEASDPEEREDCCIYTSKSTLSFDFMDLEELFYCFCLWDLRARHSP